MGDPGHLVRMVLVHWKGHDHKWGEERSLQILVGAFRQHAGGERSPPIAVLDSTVDPISDRFLPWVGENRTGAKGAWPPLTPHLEPADDLLVGEFFFLQVQQRRERIRGKRQMRGAMLHMLRGQRRKRMRAQKRVVLCLDESQAMPLDTLEALRLLTNLETEKRKLLQVVLFGQPELDRKLASDSVRQLRQRITFQHDLQTLDEEEAYAAAGIERREPADMPAEATPAIG